MDLEPVTKAIRLSTLYFVMVFLAGALLGTIREMLLQPALGVRYAELLEMPIMLLWIWQAAHYIIWQMGDVRNQNSQTSTSLTPILTGTFGFVLLLIAELLGTSIRRHSLSQAFEVYFTGRDTVAGPVHALALLAYAAMPWYVWSVQDEVDDPLMWDIDVDRQDDYCNR